MAQGASRANFAAPARHPAGPSAPTRGGRARRGTPGVPAGRAALRGPGTGCGSAATPVAAAQRPP